MATVAIITRVEMSHGATRLAEALARRGLTVWPVHPALHYLSPGAPPSLEVPRDLELVVNRLLGVEPGLTHALEWTESFERHLPAGTAVVNRAPAVGRALSKRAQASAFHTAGVPTPLSLLVGPQTTADDVVLSTGLPLVIKPDVGLGGAGLHLCRTIAETRTALGMLGDRGGVAQPYLVGGLRTLRLVMVGSRLIAAASREAKRGAWRANFAQGAAMARHVATPQEEEVARGAMSALGLDTGGVDIIDDAGPSILEVNPSPGLQGIENAVGSHVAGAIADALLACAAGSHGA